MKCFGCSKEITKQASYSLCDLCDQIFCSNSCTEAHIITYHKTNKNFMRNINFNRHLKDEKKQIISIFITEGKISQHIKYDPLYSLNNFSQVYNNKTKEPVKLGSGSYGKVYLCLNKKNKKYYALKHMDISRLKKALKSLSGIYTEIDLQSRIYHPNIIRLLYVQHSYEAFDLIMEWAPFGSLFDFIRKNKSLSEELSFQFFIQVANAIYFLHQNDMIHRDIKPENLLLFDNNNIKLCDFGWCVRLNGGQRGTFCGTTEYMAPEMVNQEVYSKEIDVWSLGVLLYEMLHGYSPFIPNKLEFNEREVMENIKIHNLKFKKGISEECKELICHLLDENKSKRYKIEDIFNSNFVKKYEKQMTNKLEITNINNGENRTQIIKKNIIFNNKMQNDMLSKNKNKKNEQLIEEDKNYHSKYESNLNNNNIRNKLNNNNKNDENKNENIITRDKSENKQNNKTAINFYPKKIIRKEISNINKINIEFNVNTPRKNLVENISSENNSSIKTKIIPKPKISAKIIPIKNKEGKNNFHIFQKVEQYFNSKNLNQKKYTNIIKLNAIESPKLNDIKKLNQKEKNEEESFKIKSLNEDKESSIINNYSIETENNNNNLNYIKNNEDNNNLPAMIKKHPINWGNSMINNISPNNKRGVKNKNNNQKKILIGNNSSNNININKINSPIIIRNVIKTNINSNNNIKTKPKMEKNNSSNLLKIKLKNYISNDNNNKTQLFGLNKEPIINEKPKLRNITDINYNSFKYTPDEEFGIPFNNHFNSKNYSSLDSNKGSLENTNENIVYKNINYLIINNNNNIISPSNNNEYQNNAKKGIIIKNLCPHSKISKTPIKNNRSYKKNIIKMEKEKEIFDYEEETKKEFHHKSKIKSKSCIKNLANKGKEIEQKIINEKIQNNNNLQKKIFPIIKEPLYNENIINFQNLDENNNIPSLNKTIKIKNIQREIEDNKNDNMQINNSFSGRKMIPNNKNNESNIRMISPVKINGYKNKIGQKKETNLGENSKNIYEKEFDVINNDDSEDEQQKTPRKTKDKVKIFPCKLLSEISKKFN